MHTCLKCGRIAQTVGELEDGCVCGSKVFVFKRDVVQQKLSGGFSSNGCENSTCTPLCPHGEMLSPPKNEEKDEKQATLPKIIEKTEKIRPIPPSGVASSIVCDEGGMFATAAKDSKIGEKEIISPANKKIKSAEENGSLFTNSNEETSNSETDEEIGREYSEVWLSKGAIIETKQVNIEGTNNVPEIGTDNNFQKGEEANLSSQAPFEVENIRQLSQGVFEVDLLGVDSGPLVVKDHEGVYYVRLPFAQAELGKKKED